MSEEERRQVLEMVQSGKISAEQGLELLRALQEDDEVAALPEMANGSLGIAAGTAESSAEPEDLPPTRSEPPPDLGKTASRWRRWWWIPLWIGVAITVFSAMFMFLAYASSGFGFWFACMWFPFLFGVLIMALAAASRTARWLHVRVHQPPGESPQKIAISFPIPIRLVGWFFRTFRNTIPGLDSVPNMDEMLKALDHITPESPFFVEVDEGDGERVEVYIG
jgi:hypothetical protein